MWMLALLFATLKALVASLKEKKYAVKTASFTLVDVIYVDASVSWAIPLG
jgi:hypothetical protein